jgi:5-methylcytosine-specific restriction endonuclease McrA
MSRAEFSKQVKRECLHRSGGLCEATGALYGLESGMRCNVSLAYGVEFDHVLADSNGGKPTLDNALAVCKKCHRYKTSHFDTPRAAKIVRQRDKHNGIRGHKHRWPSRSMSSPHYDNTRYIDREEA